MDADYLRQLGFDLSAGYVYRNGKTWGSFDAQGAVMTPEGMSLVERLEANDDPAAPPQAPALPVPRRPAAKKAAKASTEPVTDAKVLDPADDMSAALDGLSSLLDGVNT